MTEFKISIEENPAPADLDIIERALIEHNEAKSEPRNYTPLAIFLRNTEGQIVGGLRGITVWGWLFVSQLWVAETFRGQDYGTKIMEAAELEAKSRNCHAAYVDTFSFLALDFYQKVGYTVFGQLEDFPKGHTRYFLKKVFV
ncbi:MAG TPA: GNAT family N-acetyltransferase [Nitrososphaera sp.]|jgi:GNAT superfamily N-acetyltransferase|nr:GNAT family N-acetyltransferase [Nitrososphaera sp.]